MCNRYHWYSKFFTCSIALIPAKEDNLFKQSLPAIKGEYCKKGTSCVLLTCQAPVDPISVWSISPPIYQRASIILESVFHCWLYLEGWFRSYENKSGILSDEFYNFAMLITNTSPRMASQKIWDTFLYFYSGKLTFSPLDWPAYV